ncbi:uncharacterized protein LOC134700361 [Mytilus trossulus]|uniref:uncharacterized protein LOC134700361 n=1 Tax=Mytilus trossulus TaxID=6551 RepID=UPI0030069DF5
MKITIVLGFVFLVLASDLVMGRPAERQKRWDFFSRARNVFSDLGDKISDAADDVGDFAEGVADRAREGIVHAVGHLEDFGDKAGDRIGEAAQNARDAINNL